MNAAANDFAETGVLAMPRLGLVVLLVVGLLGTPMGAAGQTAAADITGTYTVIGANPGTQSQYRGTVTVTRAGEAFALVWQIGQQSYVGTGILQDGHLAVVYAVEGAPPGIATYRVSADGSLSGLWTGLGGQVLGAEVWTPRDRF